MHIDNYFHYFIYDWITLIKYKPLNGSPLFLIFLIKFRLILGYMLIDPSTNEAHLKKLKYVPLHIIHTLINVFCSQYKP